LTLGPRLRELFEEFRLVVGSRRSWGDALGPPLVFVLVNLTFGIWPAIGSAMGLALLVTALRLLRRKPLRSALAGLGGVSLASVLAIGLSRGEGYFLPGMVSSFAMSAVCLLSVIVRRPLVAWTSFLARRWPLGWYWHPRVVPAYSEVTLVWFAFFAGRLLIQFVLFRRGATAALSTANLLLGWPSIILLLAGSYLYGLWRLRHLHGPSVEEYKTQAPPPWIGQQRGF
jgi:hypothetical protein